MSGFSPIAVGGVNLLGGGLQDPRMAIANSLMQGGAQDTPLRSGWQEAARAIQGILGGAMFNKIQGQNADAMQNLDAFMKADPATQAQMAKDNPRLPQLAGYMGLQSGLMRQQRQIEADAKLTEQGLQRNPDGTVSPIPGYGQGRAGVEGDIEAAKQNAGINAGVTKALADKGLRFNTQTNAIESIPGYGQATGANAGAVTDATERAKLPYETQSLRPGEAAVPKSTIVNPPPAPGAAQSAQPSQGGELAPGTNNPTNLKTPDLKGFQSFATPEDGFAATLKQLRTYQDRGLVTPALMIGGKGQPGQDGYIPGWAPPTQNDTNAYIRFMRAGGFDPNKPVDLNDQATAARFMSRMSQFEQGKAIYTPEQAAAGFAKASAPVQVAQGGPVQSDAGVAQLPGGGVVNGNMPPRERISAEQAARSQFMDTAQVKEHYEVSKNFQSVMAAAKGNDKASDINLIDGLVKMFNPGATVRQSTFENFMEHAQGVPSNVVGLVQSWYSNNQHLQPETRQQLLDQALTRMQSSRDSYQQFASAAQDIATRQGLNPSNVVPAFEDPLTKIERERAANPDAPNPLQVTKPAAATPQRNPATQPPAAAKKAPDGNWYMPDPNRPGKYLMWTP